MQENIKIRPLAAMALVAAGVVLATLSSSALAAGPGALVSISGDTGLIAGWQNANNSSDVDLTNVTNYQLQAAANGD